MVQTKNVSIWATKCQFLFLRAFFFPPFFSFSRLYSQFFTQLVRLKTLNYSQKKKKDLNCKLCFFSPASTPSSSCFRRHHHHVPLLFSSDHHQHLHFPLVVAGTVTVSLSLMLVLLPIAVAFQSPLPATLISTSRRSSRHQLSFSSSRSCCVLLGKQKAPLLRWISGDLR